MRPSVPHPPSLLHDQAAAPQPAPATAAAPTAILGALGDPAALPAGAVLADRYRVLRHVGGGAFGVVVLVEDQVVHEEIILKFLRPHVAADESAIRRFVQELRYARRITHENVIRIHDFMTIGGCYAISMEYFPSRALSAAIAELRPMPTRRAFPIMQRICRGMTVAHREGIVHRDLKPGNVLLGEGDSVKIVDFGLAAASVREDTALTRTGLIVGTPSYIAPEQAQGGTVDARTDIYSLGIIMYEMLAGRAPYVGPDPMSILLQHVQGKPTPPRQFNPALSPALEAVILKAMALSPADRHASMDELGAAIAAVSAAEPS